MTEDADELWCDIDDELLLAAEDLESKVHMSLSSRMFLTSAI